MSLCADELLMVFDHNMPRSTTRLGFRAQVLKRALHAAPWDAEVQCLAALAAVQLVGARPTAGLARAAEAACSAALATVQRSGSPVRTHISHSLCVAAAVAVPKAY